jgi:hypothetical protein
MVAPAINNTALLDLALKNVGAIALIYGAVEATRHMDKWFMEKYYYIDTAMVPDIIYHEFAHIAMSDTMKTVHSVPVIEGMADYFATRIAGRQKMYAKIKGYSNNQAKHTKSRTLYHPYLEGSWNATSDYTLSLLWKGREEFEKLNNKNHQKGQLPVADYDQLIYRAHFDLNEHSDIAQDLTRALLSACREVCRSRSSGQHTLHYVFEQKGLN